MSGPILWYCVSGTLSALFRRHKVYSAENVYDLCYRHLDVPPPNPIMIKSEVLEFAMNASAGGGWF